MKKVSEHLKSKNKSIIKDLTSKGLKSLYNTAFGDIEKFFNPKSLFNLILNSTGIPYIDSIFNGMVSFTKNFFGKKQKDSKSKSENIKNTLKSSTSQNSATKNESKSDSPIINDEQWKNEQIQEEELKAQNEEITILREIKEILSTMIKGGNTLADENSLVSQVKNGMTGGMGAGVAGAIAGTIAGTITSFFVGLKDKILHFIPKLPILTGLTGIVWAIIDGVRGAIEFGGIEGFIGGLFGGLGKGGSGAFKNFGKWALLGAAAGMAAPPFGPIIGGAIGAMFGGILGYFGGQKISDFITDMSDFIADAFYSIGENIKLQFNLFSNTAGIVLESLYDDVVDPISEFANRIGSTFKTIWKLVKISLKEMKEEALFWVNPKNWGSSWQDSEDYKKIQEEKDQIKKEIQTENMSNKTSKPKKDLKAKLADLNKKTYEEFEENKKIRERMTDERNVRKQKERAERFDPDALSSATPKGFKEDFDWNSFKESLAQRESGGKYDIIGGASDKYSGKYQLGPVALKDIGMIKDANGDINDPSNWNIKGGREAFLKNPEMQEGAYSKYIEKMRTYTAASLKKQGIDFDSLSNEEQAGVVAAAHLTGQGAAAKMFAQGKGSSDAFGTSNKEYFEIAKNSQLNSKKIEIAKNTNPTVIKPEPQSIIESPSVTSQKPVTSDQKVQTLLAKADTTKQQTQQTTNNNVVNNNTNVRQNEKLNVSNDDYSLYMHMGPI